MKITNLASAVPSEKPHSFRVFRSDGGMQDVDEGVLVEHVLNVHFNQKLALRLVCTPSNLIELVLGHLYTEGHIGSVEEIDSIRLEPDSSSLYVEFNGKGPVLVEGFVEDLPTTGKVNYIERNTTKPLAPVPALPWDPDQVLKAAGIFESDSPLHQKTFGTHSCYIFEGDKLLYCCEDIGRHNAFDKAVGCALRDGIDLRNTFAFTSGRVPLDMAAKAIRSGIPLLVSKAVPTDVTIQLAKKYKLTLAFSAHSDSFKVVV